MIQFTKDGQGFWDFDFQALAELTTVEFSERVKKHFETNAALIKDVVFKSAFGLTKIVIYEEFSFSTYTIDNIYNEVNYDVVFYSEYQKILDHAKKVGACID